MQGLLVHVEDRPPLRIAREADDDGDAAHIDEAAVVELELHLTVQAGDTEDALGKRPDERLRVGIPQDGNLADLRLAKRHERIDEFVRIHGLLQEGADANLPAARDQARILHRGDHDDLRTRVDIVNAAAALDAIGIRQIHIHRHERRMRLLIEADSLSGVLRLRHDIEIRAVQFIGQHRATHAGVVHDHDLDLFHKCSPASFSQFQAQENELPPRTAAFLRFLLLRCVYRFYSRIPAKNPAFVPTLFLPTG